MNIVLHFLFTYYLSAVRLDTLAFFKNYVKIGKSSAFLSELLQKLKGWITKMKITQPIRDIVELDKIKKYYCEIKPNKRNYLLIVCGLNTALRITDI